MFGPSMYRRAMDGRSLVDRLTARRREQEPGIREEYSTAMGRVLTVRAGPRPGGHRPERRRPPAESAGRGSWPGSGAADGEGRRPAELVRRPALPVLVQQINVAGKQQVNASG
jgi:hypothetical protein